MRKLCYGTHNMDGTDRRLDAREIQQQFFLYFWHFIFSLFFLCLVCFFFLSTLHIVPLSATVSCSKEKWCWEHLPFRPSVSFSPPPPTEFERRLASDADVQISSLVILSLLLFFPSGRYLYHSLDLRSYSVYETLIVSSIWVSNVAVSL